MMSKLPSKLFFAPAGLCAAGWLLCGAVLAQGQDSTPAERDLQVIAALLPGTYANANQAYFDRRAKLSDPQSSFELTVVPVGEKRHPDRFAVTLEPAEGQAKEFVWNLQTGADPNGVELGISARDSETETCRLTFRRQAEQFVAQRQKGECGASFPLELIVSDRHLWWQSGRDAPIRFHRSREFSCHADVPGVGGGRDVPYKRHDGMKIHDQGGSHWFETDDGRQLGISLLRVDWPINNFDGEFARDSLVLYVREKTGGQRKEHAYGFIEDDARRIGLNLKWIMVSCYLESNKKVKPFM